MSAIRKLLTGLALLVLAFASFSIGMKEFQSRHQQIQDRRKASEGSIGYLGDLEAAVMPAKVGTGIAIVFTLSGIVFVVASAGTYVRSKGVVKRDADGGVEKAI